LTLPDTLFSSQHSVVACLCCSFLSTCCLQNFLSSSPVGGLTFYLQAFCKIWTSSGEAIRFDIVSPFSSDVYSHFSLNITEKRKGVDADAPTPFRSVILYSY
ncbi:MAG: hypothetical protein IJ955_03500, partial [Oscillospiraceae bacterium]|nr:hypothetical protein [Oscillospiraceae bacterium]